MKLFEAVLDLLFPPRCAFCHRLLVVKGDGVCRPCREALPLTGALAEQTQFRHLSRCVSPLFYENTVRASLHRYKFGGLRGYAGIYAAYVVKCIDEKEISCDIITWAPVSGKRLRVRGYDQAELLAREIAARLGRPCVKTLEKTRDNPPQSRAGSAKQRAGRLSLLRRRGGRREAGPARRRYRDLRRDAVGVRRAAARGRRERRLRGNRGAKKRLTR